MTQFKLELDRERTYQGTHPWIDFALDLSRFPHTLWMLLGESRSRCQHIAGVPLPPAVAEKLYHVYLSKGVHATTSIEGNTLTEEQVLRKVESGLDLPPSQEYLGDEVQNIIDACNEIASELLDDPTIRITPARICHFNALVLRNLNVEEGVVPGAVREHSVTVGTVYRGAPAGDCRFLLEALCSWLNDGFPEVESDDMRFAMVVCKAVLAHLYVAWIHPFGDGNGRTARLMEFQILVQSGLVPLPAGHLLSNHYNKTRSRYYQELNRSSKVKHGAIGFIDYAVQGFVDGLEEQLDHIRNIQWKITWVNFVHDQFRNLDTPASVRRRHLVLDMPAEPTPRRALTSVSVRVSSDYHGKGEKTLSRDLNALLTMKLIARTRRGFIPNRELIRAFLPPKVNAHAAPAASRGT